MNKYLLFTGILLSIIYFNCNDSISEDDIVTTMPQEHILWPSLADSPWPMYRHDPQGTGRSALIGPQSASISCELIAFGINTSNAFTSFAIGSDSTVYFGSSYDTDDSNTLQLAYLYAINSNCTIKWKYLLSGAETERAPLVRSDGTVIYPSLQSIYALDENGVLLWKYDVDSPPSEINIGLDGVIYFNSGGGLYALNTNGTLKWYLQEDEEFKTDGTGGVAMSPDGQTIYVAGAIGYQNLYAVNTISKEIEWSFFCGDSTLKMASNPIVDNQGNIYIAPQVSHLEVVDHTSLGLYSITENGDIRWKYGQNGISNDQYTIDKNGYITLGISNNIIQLDYSGNERWRMAISLSQLLAPLINDANGNIYSVGSTLISVSGEIGTSNWELDISESVWQCPIIGFDGILYLGFSGNEGYKYVYSIQ